MIDASCPPHGHRKVRSCVRRYLGIEPTAALLPHSIVNRGFHLGESNLVQIVRAIDGNDRPNSDTRRLHVDAQESNAILYARLAARAHEATNPIRIMSLASPDLHTVDHVFVANSFGAGVQA